MNKGQKSLLGTASGLAALAAAVVVLPASAAGPGTEQGPSSSQSPYLVRVKQGVITKSIITAGDTVNGYTMAGIPDGLGAYDNGDGTFTVLMNHELTAGSGVPRAHGATGAFVSKWRIDSKTLAVLSGEDLIQRLYRFADGTWQAVTGTELRLARLCSADLPDPSAFYDAASGLGTTQRIFMDGEENGSIGRPLATVVTGPDAGSSYVVTALGRMSFENTLAKPGGGAATVVAAMNDAAGPSYVYVGQKKDTGNDVEKAGLTGGTLYAIRIDGVGTEGTGTAVPSGGARFSLLPLGDVSTKSGAEIDAAARGAGATIFNRAEDGSWDPSNASNYYFNTTASFTGVTRTWHLRFDNPADVTGGGVADIAIQGTPAAAGVADANQAGPRMLDNLTVNAAGQVVALEDVGGNDYLGGVYAYDPATGALERVAQHDPDRFTAGAPNFLTTDEESSGVIPAPFLGTGKYLIDVQSHHANTTPGVVEDGQLLVLTLPAGKKVG